MPREFGQRINPSWDALRAKTIFGSAAFDVANSAAGGGLTNQIIVWHADASPLGFFDLTEAGLNAAIAVLGMGDTAAIPSCTIALTAGITLPDNTALLGFGATTVLSFSGFSGTAITTGANCMLREFNFEFVSNGTTAIGVDASDGTEIDEVDITVSGGSATNNDIGAVNPHTAQEAWTLTLNGIGGAGNGVLYSPNAFSGGSVNWYLIAMPADAKTGTNFLDANSALQGDQRFGLSQDGNILFIRGVNTSSINCVWQLTNLAAIRSNPATAPSWSVIAKNDDTLSPDGSWRLHVINQTITAGNLLYMASVIRVYPIGDTTDYFGYWVYDGSNWTLTPRTNTQPHGDAQVNQDFSMQENAFTQWRGLRISTNSIYGTYQTGQSRIWKQVDDYSKLYTCVRRSIGGVNHTLIHEYSADIDVFDYGADIGQLQTLTGAWYGPQVYAVRDSNGNAYLSNDGSNGSFSLLATWVAGWLYDTKRSGGGDLAWIRKSDAGGGTVLNLYNRAGSVLADLTGDMWSSISGLHTFYNLGIKYS